MPRPAASTTLTLLLLAFKPPANLHATLYAEEHLTTALCSHREDRSTAGQLASPSPIANGGMTPRLSGPSVCRILSSVTRPGLSGPAQCCGTVHAIMRMQKLLQRQWVMFSTSMLVCCDAAPGTCRNARHPTRTTCPSAPEWCCVNHRRWGIPAQQTRDYAHSRYGNVPQAGLALEVSI